MKHGRKLLAVLLACCLVFPMPVTVHAEETTEPAVQTEESEEAKAAETAGEEKATEETKGEEKEVTEDVKESGDSTSGENTEDVKPEEKAEAEQSLELTGAGEATVAMQNEGAAVAAVEDKNYATLQEAVNAANNGTVKLLEDVTLTTAVTVQKNYAVTLDLNGKKITSGAQAILVQGGALTVKDSTAVQPTVNGKDVSGYTGGSVEAESTAVDVSNGGSLVLVSGKLVSKTNLAVGVKGNWNPKGSADTSPVACSATINGGYLVGQEGAAGVYGRGAQVTVNGGVLEALDNAVVAGNGTDSNTSYYGGTTITINGGTLVGHIQSNGYIACGIYQPQNGTLNITGGTIYADGGVGILVRGGKLNMTDGTVVTTGAVSGKVGDSKIISTCYGVYVDGTSEYPGAREGGLKAEISGGKVETGAGVPVVNLTNKAGGTVTGTLKVTGGSYSAAVPEEYLPEGCTTTQGADSYYTLNEKKIAEISGKTYPSLLKAAEAAKSGDTIKMLEDENLADYLTIDVSRKVTLDLNGHTVVAKEDGSKDTLIVNGELTVRDTAGGGKLQSKMAIEAAGTAAKITVESGTIEVTEDYGFYARDGGTIVVNGGTLTSLDAVLTGNNTTGDMNFTVNGGTLTAQRGPAIYMPGRIELNVTGGTLNGGISLRMGKVRISGGTINAITKDIDSPAEYYSYSGNAWLPDALYVFGGTYTAETGSNDLDLEITGGTFNCNNDVGSAVAIYDLGKVEQNMTVKISGDAGLFNQEEGTGRKAYQVLSLADIGVTSPKAGYGSYSGHVDSRLSGGYYSNKVKAEYIVKGKVCNQGSYAVNGQTYAYTIGDPEESTVVTEPGENKGFVSDKVDVAQKDTAKKIAQNVALTGDAALTAAAAPIRDAMADDPNTVKKSAAALEKAGVTVSDLEKVTTVVEPYLETTVTGIVNTEKEKRIELDIKMYYNIKAKMEGTDTVATVSEGKQMPEAYVAGKELKITVTIPHGIFSEGDQIFVKHTKEDGTVYYHAATLEISTEKDTITFTNSYGFSGFVIGVDNRSATVKYEDGTASGTTVSYVPKDVNVTALPAGPAKSGYTFKGWRLVTPAGSVLGTYTGKLTDALLSKMAEVNGTITAKPVYEENKSNTTTVSSNSETRKKHHSSGSSKTAATVKAAKTGDETNIWLPAGLLVLAVTGLGCCIVYNKKKHEN